MKETVLDFYQLPQQEIQDTDLLDSFYLTSSDILFKNFPSIPLINFGVSGF